MRLNAKESTDQLPGRGKGYIQRIYMDTALEHALNRVVLCYIYMYTQLEIFTMRKVSPILPAAPAGKNFICNFFFCVNDYKEDAVAFTVLVKN